MMRIARYTITVAAVFGVGCGMMDTSQDDMQRQRVSRQASASSTTPPSAAATEQRSASPEARLLGFLNLANKDDLEGGRLAQERAHSSSVKTYGRQMERDHMQLLNDSERAAQELGILPVMGPETQPLVRDHEQTMQRLQSASGAEFDRMYVSHEIEMHKQVLQTAASLAGQIQDPKLTMMVRNARPILEAHLHAAEQLLAEQR